MTPNQTQDLSVIAPCLNEEPNVPVLVERTLAVFDEMGIRAELVLIDDGSTDKTWGAINDAMRRDARVRGARHPKNRGMVNGWVTGLSIASGPLICLIDSDLQNRPEDIPRLYEVYRQDGPDIVQAVRHASQDLSRKVFSRVFNHVLNVTFGMQNRDNKSGFILCKREVLYDVLYDADRYRYFQNFLGVAAGVRGYRFSEVDTPFDRRHAGESFLSDFPIAFSLKVFREMARYRVATLGVTKRR